MKEILGVDNSTCSQYCTNIFDWIKSDSAGSEIQNTNKINMPLFSKICGNNFSPYTTKPYSKKILSKGIIISVIISIFIFIWCTRLQIKPIKTNVISVFSFMMMIGISIFLSVDFEGEGSCVQSSNGYEFKCKSKITGLTLPNSLCSYFLNCECNFNSDCSSGCYCMSSTCLSNTKSRASKKINIENISYSRIIILIIFGIVLSISYATIFKDRESIISWLLLFFPVIVMIFRKPYLTTQRNVYTEKCS